MRAWESASTPSGLLVDLQKGAEQTHKGGGRLAPGTVTSGESIEGQGIFHPKRMLNKSHQPGQLKQRGEIVSGK
jgi:hypothetical protein